jgi:acyl carrier protein
MNEQQVLGHISQIVTRLVADKGGSAAPLDAATELLGGGVGIDSLDLAMLVRELEEVTGFDPFHQGFVEFRTAGELARLYTT